MRPLLHAFFHDNGGQHVKLLTYLQMLFSYGTCCPSMDVNMCTVPDPNWPIYDRSPYTKNDCKLGGWRARLSLRHVQWLSASRLHTATQRLLQPM